MTDWTRQVRAQTRLIIDQIASTRMRLSEMGIESEGSLESYYQMLERLFDSDMQLAKLRDNSDLLLRAEGDAFDQDPRIQIVSSVFSNVTDQVTDLTKAILGTRSDGKVTNKAVDLGLRRATWRSVAKSTCSSGCISLKIHKAIAAFSE